MHFMGLSSGVSEHLLRVTAQHLQTQSDVVHPTARVNAEITAEQRRIKNSKCFFVWVVISCEDLWMEKKDERHERV